MVTSFIDGSGIMCFLDILHLNVYEGHEVWGNEYTLRRVCSAVWAHSWKQVVRLPKESRHGSWAQGCFLPVRPWPRLPLLEQCYYSQVSMAFLAHELAQVAGDVPPFPSLHHCTPWVHSVYCFCHQLGSSMLSTTNSVISLKISVYLDVPKDVSIISL